MEITDRETAQNGTDVLNLSLFSVNVCFLKVWCFQVLLFFEIVIGVVILEKRAETAFPANEKVTILLRLNFSSIQKNAL